MRERVNLFRTKLHLSAKTIAWLSVQWRYGLLALVISALFFELTYWLLNMNVIWTILTSTNVTIDEKLVVLASPFHSIFVSSGAITLALMIVLSLVQGVNIAALAYVMKHQKKADANVIGGSSLVGLLAVIGLGCPACGTSLVTPIVALFVSSSAVAVSENIMTVVLPLALLVGTYGLYSIGLKAATAKASSNNNEDNTILINVNDLQ